MASMSVKAYARHANSNPRSVRRGISSGLIPRNPDGTVDVEAADANWASQRRSSRLGRHQDTEAGRHSAHAKVAHAATRLKFLQAKFAALNARWHDRDNAISVSAAEARVTLDLLRAAVDSPAGESFAATLRLDRAAAREILHRFIALILDDVGDLEAMARRDAEQA